MATRLANADLLPLDYRPYAARVDEFLNELERNGATTFPLARAANKRFAEAASRAAAREDAGVNAALMKVERALLDPAGIPGRPWYRHQIYAPKFTYAPEVLPGLAEAIDARDAARIAEQEKTLAAALDRAAAALGSPSNPE
jgi:N-acetylated-alpha-linked acidic dipeptidase